MNVALFKKSLELLRKDAPKRKFSQSVDFIINLKSIDLKKPEEQVDIFVSLPKPFGKKKICALVGAELIAQARSCCDFAVGSDEFSQYAGNKKLVKKLARSYDFFIAQINNMGDVAKVFGRILGPLGKMPNPKAGCVVPPNANLKPLIERLQNTVRLTNKGQFSVKALVGVESMSDDELSENMNSVYSSVVHKLPLEFDNIKNVLVKFTMSKPVNITVLEREARE